METYVPDGRTLERESVVEEEEESGTQGTWNEKIRRLAKETYDEEVIGNGVLGVYASVSDVET